MTNPGWGVKPRPAAPSLPARLFWMIVLGAVILGAISMAARSDENMQSSGPNSFYTINNDKNFIISGISVLTIAGPAATISADGAVKINWQRIEQIVARPKEWDGTTVAMARALIAVRDGTYEKQE